MKKNNKLIVISLVAVIAIYGTYKIAFANNLEHKLVEKVSERIENKSTGENFVQDKNESNVTKLAKKVLKKITKPKSDELVINDDEDEEENCYRQVYIPGAQELCLDEEEDDYTIVSDGTREGRKQALAQKALEIKEKNFGGKSPIDDPSIGSRVCKVVLAEQLFTKSHQGDLYQIYFCNDKEQVASVINVESGGIDSDGIEYILPMDYKSYAPSIVLSEDYRGMETEEELKKRNEFNSKDVIPRDTKISEKIVLDSIGDAEIVSTRYTTFTDMPEGATFHEVTVREDGQLKKYYTGAFDSDVVFTEQELKAFKERVDKVQEIMDNLTGEEWSKLEISGKTQEFLGRFVTFTDKENKYTR